MTAEITEEPVDQPEQATDPPEQEAPFGWMNDPDTGVRRPRKRPGRRSKASRAPAGKTPPLEELQALGTLSEASEDTAPGAPPKGRRKARMKTDALPPFRAGVIAKGMNGLYRRAGRLLRVFDYDTGSAVIACTRAEDEDDVTVGDAWEDLAKTNPRIRAFLLKLMTGGAWTALFTAHLPILLALAMKESIRDRIPLLGLAETLLTDEPEPGGAASPSDLSQAMGGIGPEDLAQMVAMAQNMMGDMTNGQVRGASVPREPTAGPE